MLKRKFAIILAAGAVLAGLGVASAFADNPPTTPATQQDGQEGIDEQGAADDVATAAVDVQDEADDQSADDQSGDQQGPNDQSEEQGDDNQSDQADSGD